MAKQQTVEDIKNKYPNAMTATHNRDLLNSWVGDEEFPSCNYCVGGALQLALGEIEPHDDDARNGIFPSSDDLGDTLHYFCKIPYARTDTLLSLTCHFYEHKGQECVQSSEGMGETAYELADEITRANDRGDFGYAWSCVEVALNYKENN